MQNFVCFSFYHRQEKVMTKLGLIIKQNTCTEEYLIFYINLLLYMYIRGSLVVTISLYFDIRTIV